MWFQQPNEPADWSIATRHLSRADARMRAVIRRVGPCTLAPRRDYFVALCKAIYAQQISTRVATVLFGRFCKRFPSGRPTPQRVLDLLNGGPTATAGCGLSRQKTAYLLDLATHFNSKKIQTRSLASMPDEQVIETLVQVKGVGRWTAEMFLMFVLNRPDVLPVDDLGLREGVREIYELPKRPGSAELMRLGEPWRPYRSIATWYVWRRGVVAAGGIAK